MQRRGSYRFDPQELELLSNLVQQGDFAHQALWHVSLTTVQGQCVNAHATIVRRTTDDATTTNDSSLAASIQRAPSSDQVWAIDELVTRTLLASTGTRGRPTIRVCDPSNGSAPLPPLACDSALWALHVLRKCLSDEAFAHRLQYERDLFDQLMVALACPNADVSSAAAWALWDAVLLPSQRRPLQRNYRPLSYFTNLRAHDEIFTFAPSTARASALPACFAVVESWIQFYATRARIESLQTSVETRRHLEAVQAVALYYVTQCFSQIFITAGEDTRDVNAQTRRRAARARHTSLCAALMRIACVPATNETCDVRALAMELLAALCSVDRTAFPVVDLFCDAQQLDTLLALLETTASTRERLTTLRLVRTLAGVGAIKAMCGISSSGLLARLVRWLADQALATLQSSATTILREIITQSPHGTVEEARQSEALLAVAEALFTDPHDSVQAIGGRDDSANARVLHTVTVTARLDDPSMAEEAPRMSSAAGVSVILHFYVASGSGNCLREFQHRDSLREDHTCIAHRVALEPKAKLVLCNVVLATPLRSTRTIVRQLRLQVEQPGQADTATARVADTSVVLAATSSMMTGPSVQHSGVLGRLISSPTVTPDVLADAVVILTELAQSQAVFCAPHVRLGDHLVAAMEATQRTHKRRVDVALLNALTPWCSGLGLTRFQSSWDALMSLLERLRGSSVLTAAVGLFDAPSSAWPQPFLVALVDWLATLDAVPLTDNCLNALFLQHGDVLLALAPLFFPDRSAPATVFALVSIAVSRHSLHCEIFARTHTLRMLTTLLDDRPSTRPSHETLQHAARVLEQITRAGATVVTKFLRHDGLEFFGRVAFCVLCNEGGDDATAWPAARHAAADSLVLASSYLCEAAADGTALPAATDSERASLDRLTWRHDAERPHQLSVVETLLLYLAADASADRASRRPVLSSIKSRERLAARVLRAWIEKWPGDSATFQRNLVAAVNVKGRVFGFGKPTADLAASYAAGFRQCLALTRWDFVAELHAVRVSYAAAVAAGVRTGVLPRICRSTFAAFDKDFLRDLGHQGHTGDHESTGTLDADAVRQLEDGQAQRKEMLASHRTQSLLSRVRQGDSSARVARAIHAVLVVVDDAFADASVDGAFADASVGAVAARIVRSWLVLLEQIMSLICCALHELDAAYYGDKLSQLHALLVSELPRHLAEMHSAGVSRYSTVRRVLTDLELLLRLLTSEHELHGVTPANESLAQHAEVLLGRYDRRRQVGQALAPVLATRDGGVERVERAIAAAEFAWRQVLHASQSDSITRLMAEPARASESLGNRLRRYGVSVAAAVRHPRSLVASLHFPTRSSRVAVESETAGHDASKGGNAPSEQRNKSQGIARALGVHPWQVLVAHAPFMALESLLEHDSVLASGVEKQIALLDEPALRPRAASAFARALGVDVVAVEALTATELTRDLTRLHNAGLDEAAGQLEQPGNTLLPPPPASQPTSATPLARLRGLLEDLQTLVDDNGLGVHLHVVVQRPQRPPPSLWQSMLVSERRGRLIAACDCMEALENQALRPTFDPLNLASHDHPELHQSLLMAARARMPHSRFSTSLLDPFGRVETLKEDPFVALAVSETVDPLSEDSVIAPPSPGLASRHRHSPLWRLLPNPLSRRLRRALRRCTHWCRRAGRALLPLAFWRHEELERDLANAALARRFASLAERDAFVAERHLRKAASELMRVWMPESGSLGLPLWHTHAYFVGGSLLCVTMACVAPPLLRAAGASPHACNTVMTAATNTLVAAAFVCAAASMYNISKEQFVVQQRSRVRFMPLTKFYPNLLAVVALVVEIVQLNAIAFDPQLNYSSADQIPRLVRWLGDRGIAEIQVNHAELKVALGGVALVSWLVLLKCANKFPESHPTVNRVVTKDLPAVLQGSLYMGLLSIFFSFLVCVDCATKDGSQFHQCKKLDQAPFMLYHSAIPCWTGAHALLALLGLWGITFFLPIALLAQGMNHVLFASAALDVRFAPVVTLSAQLAKAVLAAARAFFPLRPVMLAGIALANNALLFALMATSGGGRGTSRWYLRHVKSGIFAASAWAAACGIYRAENESRRSVATNLMHVGWIAIGVVSTGWLGFDWIRHPYVRQARAVNEEMDEAIEEEEEKREAAENARSQLQTPQQQPQQQNESRSDDDLRLSAVETRFLRDAALVSAVETNKTRALVENAIAMADDEPPELRAFMRNARAFAEGRAVAHMATFAHKARQLARKIDHSEWTTAAIPETRTEGLDGRVKSVKAE